MTTTTKRPRQRPSLRSVAARNALVEANIRWAYGAARLFHGKIGAASARAYTIEEAESDAMFGLLRAAELFDESKGFRFTTFAIHWMRNRMMEGLALSSLVRVPRYVGIADRPGIHSSMDVLLDRIPDREEGHRADRAVATLRVALAALPDRLRDLYEMRVGGMNNTEIGVAIGVSKERVRQLMSRARRMMVDGRSDEGRNDGAEHP